MLSFVIESNIMAISIAVSLYYHLFYYHLWSYIKYIIIIYCQLIRNEIICYYHLSSPYYSQGHFCFKSKRHVPTTGATPPGGCRRDHVRRRMAICRGVRQWTHVGAARIECRLEWDMDYASFFQIIVCKHICLHHAVVQSDSR